MEKIVLVISDMNAFLSKENIKKINEKEGTDYPELDDTITYRMLYDSREPIGSQRGYFQYLSSVGFWVLPYLEGVVTIDPTSTAIKEYSVEDYKTNILPLWDKQEIEL